MNRLVEDDRDDVIETCLYCSFSGRITYSIYIQVGPLMDDYLSCNVGMSVSGCRDIGMSGCWSVGIISDSRVPTQLCGNIPAEYRRTLLVHDRLTIEIYHKYIPTVQHLSCCANDSKNRIEQIYPHHLNYPNQFPSL
jgi:hypothetical protein